jgi:hypothetical protein
VNAEPSFASSRQKRAEGVERHHRVHRCDAEAMAERRCRIERLDKCLTIEAHGTPHLSRSLFSEQSSIKFNKAGRS